MITKEKNVKIFLDIETVKSSREDLPGFIAKKLKPPGNIKKEESIEKWWKEKSQESIHEKILKTPLSGDYGEIISISWAVNDNPINNVFRKKGESERVLLEKFTSLVTEEVGVRAISLWVGHNISKFDLPFLYKRMIINQIETLPGMPINPKQWDKSVFDTSAEWAGYGNYISQDELCFILGLPQKPDDINGSNVGGHYENENYEKIIEYNNSDVETVRNIYNRLTK